MESKYAANVSRGVAFLDETMPEWWRVIDLITFRIVNDRNCVLGQVYRSAAEQAERSSGYNYAADLYGLTEQGLDNLGFCITGPSTYQDWAELESEWVRVIEELKSAEESK